MAPLGPDKRQMLVLDLSSGAMFPCERAHSLDVDLERKQRVRILKWILPIMITRLIPTKTLQTATFSTPTAAPRKFLYSQPTDIASVDAMKSGDKLYFAQVKEGLLPSSGSGHQAPKQKQPL